MMYESLKYYVVRAWALGLTGSDAVEYISETANVDFAVAEIAVSRLSLDMSE